MVQNNFRAFLKFSDKFLDCGMQINFKLCFRFLNVKERMPSPTFSVNKAVIAAMEFIEAMFSWAFKSGYWG